MRQLCDLLEEIEAEHSVPSAPRTTTAEKSEQKAGLTPNQTKKEVKKAA
jgi:hypothetical protein